MQSRDTVFSLLRHNVTCFQSDYRLTARGVAIEVALAVMRWPSREINAAKAGQMKTGPVCTRTHERATHAE